MIFSRSDQRAERLSQMTVAVDMLRTECGDLLSTTSWQIGLVVQSRKPAIGGIPGTNKGSWRAKRLRMDLRVASSPHRVGTSYLCHFVRMATVSTNDAGGQRAKSKFNTSKNKSK